MNTRLRLAELLVARLSHDISGQVGTLMGAISMLDDDADSAAEARELAEDVAGSLARRLKLLRAAWGGGSVSLRGEELQEHVRAMVHGRRIGVDLSGARDTASLPSSLSRVLLNALMLAVESLPAGGQVALGGDATTGFTLTITGDRAAWPKGMAGYIVDIEEAWRSVEVGAPDAVRTLQGPLTAIIAGQEGVTLRMLMAARTETAPPLFIAAAR